MVQTIHASEKPAGKQASAKVWHRLVCDPQQIAEDLSNRYVDEMDENAFHAPEPVAPTNTVKSAKGDTVQSARKNGILIAAAGFIGVVTFNVLLPTQQPASATTWAWFGFASAIALIAGILIWVGAIAASFFRWVRR
jgi:hypothetical protein